MDKRANRKCLSVWCNQFYMPRYRVVNYVTKTKACMQEIMGFGHKTLFLNTDSHYNGNHLGTE